jgi:uncharacterized MnhB-related membrane protein
MILGTVSMFIFKSNMISAMIYGIVSLGAVILFIIMKAPDVAITEAAIGVLLSFIILVYSIVRIEENIEKS